ncbi:hypothetical protein JAAARDRAFT_38199 [Jaapia argillacea MUCL 33604]|uniref:Uncharacterized protein n=1 Tax=Jaapia argillacea MUCL 33604 TaxID=933084 RepID=A0A067PIC2_9AGAM|nr:hypothetical protein JAAARDRAFT_38199 [Jaapia argillacea MUCL 33604]
MAFSGAPAYPITRPYPWRHFTLIFVTFSFLALVILTILNAGVQGYDSIVVVRSNYNYTQHMWWTPLVPKAFRPSSTCSSHLFNVGDIFGTNNSFFEWTVLRVEPPNSTDSTTIGELDEGAGFPYTASPMSMCRDVSERYIDSFIVMVESSTATLKAWAMYTCENPVGADFMIEGRWEFFIPETGDNIMLTDKSATGPQVRDVLQRLAQDLLEAVMSPPSPGTASFSRIGVAGTTYCPSFQHSNGTLINSSYSPSLQDRLQCSQAPLQLGLNTGQVSWVNGLSSYELTASELGDPRPYTNFLKALSGAAEIDLGIYKPNSIYFNTTMLTETIEPYALPSGSHFLAASGDYNLSWPYGAQSSLANNFSGAQILRMYPEESEAVGFIPMNSSFQNPVIINVSYLCRELHIKSALSFIASVFVGTASMFMAWLAFGLYIATTLAKRSPEANYCEGSSKLRRESYPLSSARSSSSTYYWGSGHDSKPAWRDWSKDAYDAVSPSDGRVESVPYDPEASISFPTPSSETMASRRPRSGVGWADWSSERSTLMENTPR